jgi:L-threonylcarbamoyladenylate synthase
LRYLPLSGESIRIAAELLRGGGLAAFPTETVYGLGGDAFNPAALARIFEAKGRPRFDPLIVHIADMDGLDRAASLEVLPGERRDQVEKLCAVLWPGPLTLVLPKRPALPDLATSGLPSVALRLPAHPAARELIRLSTGAVAAPSANPFGRLSPTRAEHVRDGLGDRVDIILDGGRCGVGLESTVLDLCGGLPRILRPGGTPRERIEALIGPVETAPPLTAPGELRSPGQLSSHYAPRTPLSLFRREALIRLPCRQGEGRLFFSDPGRETWPEGAVVRVLSPRGDSAEAAASLFELLHELDGLGLEAILAEEAPPGGLGPAINDRLRRASAR